MLDQEEWVAFMLIWLEEIIAKIDAVPEEAWPDHSDGCGGGQ